MVYSLGVGKKLEKACATKGCQELATWKKSILNHLWWTVSSTPDLSYEDKQAKWQSVLFHVQDIHTNLPFSAFSECAHDELHGDRQWLEASE